MSAEPCIIKLKTSPQSASLYAAIACTSIPARRTYEGPAEIFPVRGKPADAYLLQPQKLLQECLEPLFLLGVEQRHNASGKGF